MENSSSNTSSESLTIGYLEQNLPYFVRGLLLVVLLFLAVTIGRVKAANIFEGGENGLSNVTVQSDGVNAGSGMLSTRFSADTVSHSFRLLLDGFSMQDEWMMLNNAVVAGAGSELRFQSMLGLTGDGEMAMVQVTTSAAAVPAESSWSTVYLQKGNASGGETAFTPKTVALGTYAGQTIRVRFLYRLDPGHNWFWQNWENAGWFVDQIEIYGATANIFEGGENGLSNVTVQSDGVNAGSGMLSTRFSADTVSHSFRLLLDGFSMQDEWMMLNNAVVAGAGSELRFQSMLGLTGDGEMAMVQVTTSAAAVPAESSWSTVYLQRGNASGGETAFTQKTVALGTYAGQTIRVRFLYRLDPGHNWFWQNWENAGWFLDHLELTNVTIANGNPTTNTAPVALSGSLTVTEDTAMTGTLAATDVDGGALSYSIVGQGSKGIAAIANPTNGAFTYTPNLNSNGSDSFSFKATDAEGATSNVATVSVAIAAVNDAPSISLIPNQNTAGGVPISPIPITVADVDSSVNSLVLSAASSNTAIVSVANIQFGGSAANRTIIVTPSVGQIGITTVTVTVSDGSASTNTVFTVAQDPAAPQISSSLVATATRGQSFSYQIVGSNSPISFAASNLVNGLTLNPSTGVISGTPTAPGVYAVTLSASNSGGAGSAILTLTVNPPAPVISSTLSISATKGDPFTYQIVASNSPASYAASGLIAGLSINPNTGLISGSPAAMGVSTVTLSATNAGGTGSAALILTVNPPAPQISSSLSVVATKDQAFSYQIVASNIPTSYGANGLPTGLSINASTGLMVGVPTATGNSTVTLTATNAGGTGSAVLLLTVNPPAPQISSPLSAEVIKGQAFSYQIVGSNSPVSYAASGLPSGVVFNPSTGAITGMPTATGVFLITLSASNSGGSGSAVLTLTVNSPSPQITSALTTSATRDQAFSYQIVGSNSPTSYGASGLPSGLEVNTVTGLISGTPTSTAVSTVTLTASNNTGTGSATLILTVALSPQPPVISATPFPAGKVGDIFVYQIAASNSPTSYGATGLPGGLSVNGSTGLISGIPVSAGESSVTLTSTNSVGNTAKMLTLKVNPPAPEISSALSASGPKGETFSYQIAASNSPTRFAAIGLPAGLSVNISTGLISGTPMTSGASSVTLTATNAGGIDSEILLLMIEDAFTSATLTVAVAPANGGRVMAGFFGSTSRAIGLSYTITAVPAPGFVFSSWSGSASGGSPTLVFTMADGFSLQANFMPDPLLTARGVFNGLALADVPINGTTGRVKIVIGLGGKFTGKLVLAGIYYPISGAFGVDGSATFGDGKRATRALLRQGAATLDLALHLDVNGGGHHITGTLSDAGNVVSMIQADHTLFTDAKNPVSPRRNVPVELRGAYTFLFPPVVADGVVAPKGNGWGRAIVMPNGAVRIAGTLADGTAFSSSTVLAQDATLPLYVPLYNNGGAVCGKVSLVSEAGNDVSGNVVWFRPPTPGRLFYPAGWKDGIILGLRGSHFQPTVAAAGRGAAPINVSVTLSGGNLDADLIASAFLSSAGVTLESAQAIRGFSLNVNSASGVFSGRFIPPGGRAMETFKGVVLQNQNAAAGFFLGSTESGSIEVAEPNMSN